VIVASSLKRHGKITETIDPIRVAAFIEAMQEGLAAQKPLVEMTPPLKSAVV
jgi:hypothetical protein